MVRIEGCWASGLGDCVGKLSLEHFISLSSWQVEDPQANRAAKEGHVITVETGLGRRVQTKSMRLRNYGRRMLCEHHNNSSSEIDLEGKRFSDAVRAFYDIARTRQHTKLRWALREFKLDGALLERWFLKTAINMSVGVFRVGLPIGGLDAAPDLPTLPLVEMVYGRRPVIEPFGLWFVAEPGPLIRWHENFTLRFWHGPGGYVAGAVFSVIGLSFVVSISDDGPWWDFVRRRLRSDEFESIRPFRGVGSDQLGVRLLVEWPHGDRAAVTRHR
jgi:hypothetical protein